MKKSIRRHLSHGLAAAGILFGASAAAAASPADLLFKPGADKLQLQLASYTHYKSSDDYEGPPIYGGAEVMKANNWFYGVGLFNNSYSQFSQYLYVGHRFDLYQTDDMTLHLKLSAGALHGYHDEHEDSLPVTVGDIGPVIIPSLGVHFGRWSFDLVFLVDEAMMFNLGFNVID